MSSTRKQTEPKVTIIPTLCAFPLLDCSKPAFRHLRVRSAGYESMLPVNQAIPPKKYVELPKRRNRK